MGSKASDDIPTSDKKTRPPCSSNKSTESDDTKNANQKTQEEPEDSFDSGSEVDNSDDEDFSLKGPKKKRKKVKKKRVEKERRTRTPKNIRRVPTFDEVAQIHHAYFDYDIFASETSSIDDGAEETLDERLEAERTRSPTPELKPPREKKKRIIIYPWNPIGITGGRPIADVSKLS